MPIIFPIVRMTEREMGNCCSCFTQRRNSDSEGQTIILDCVGQQDFYQLDSHSAEATRGLSSSIDALRPKLREIIETDYGLLSYMNALQVLTDEEYTRAKAEGNVYLKVDAILSYVIKKPEELCEKFLIALTKSDQLHVVNFIQQSRGVFTSDSSRDLPLDSVRRSLLTMNRPAFVEKNEWSVMLLQKLWENECINKRQKATLELESRSIQEKNSLLLDMLIRGSIASFENFKKCLLETNQGHLVPLFERDAVV